MTIHRSWPFGTAAGGCLLGVVSAFWLAKSMELIVGNARCCLLAAEGDARRGIFLATIGGGFQLATLAVAVAVIRRRAQRGALAVIMTWGAITVLLLAAGGASEAQLWLNLIALVVAGLAVLAELVVVRWSATDGDQS